MNDAQKRALEPKLAMTLFAHLEKNKPRGYSLGELSAEFKVDPARAHYRLSELVDADLVEMAHRGTTVIYRFKADPNTERNP
jgi:DNA-binding IclR family transcriptional regulator